MSSRYDIHGNLIPTDDLQCAALLRSNGQIR